MTEQGIIKPLIFISHSAKDPQARTLLARLYRALSKDYEVLFDRVRLRAGNPWRRELHTWMALCHGAVIILSDDAVRHSPWVKKESAILVHRRERDDQFILIPVLTPVVSKGNLRQGDFQPLELDAIQMAEGETDSVVEQVLRGLEPLKETAYPTTPLQQVEYVVGDILSELDNKPFPNPLVVAAAKLGRRIGWRSDRRYSAQLARLLLSVDFEEALNTLVFLAVYFKEKKTVLRIVGQLEPFWVDPDAVSGLAWMNTQPRGQRAVSVSGVQYPFTGRCYIQRACSGTYNWTWVIIGSQKGLEELKPEERAKLIEEEIERQLLAHLKLDEELGAEPTTEDIERRLNQLEKEEPFFVLVPKGFSEEVTALLRKRFESFTFFMLEGSRAPTAPGLRDWQIMLLQPDLTAGRDQAVFDLIGSTKRKIDKTP